MASVLHRLRPITRALTSWPVGVALAGFTWIDQQDDPPHFVSPFASGIFAAYSAASMLTRPTSVGLAAHALNIAVQGVKISSALTVDEAKHALQDGLPRTRVVVLGSGWGSMSFVKNLPAAQTGEGGWYDLTVISPRNYFLYTPLLPGAVTGTVEAKSIVESVRALLKSASIDA